MPASTPGQLAYAAWWRVRYAKPPAGTVHAYHLLSEMHQRAWEAAAEAVRDLVRRELVDGFAQRRAEQQAGRAREKEETRG